MTTKRTASSSCLTSLYIYVYEQGDCISSPWGSGSRRYRENRDNIVRGGRKAQKMGQGPANKCETRKGRRRKMDETSLNSNSKGYHITFRFQKAHEHNRKWWWVIKREEAGQPHERDGKRDWFKHKTGFTMVPRILPLLDSYQTPLLIYSGTVIFMQIILRENIARQWCWTCRGQLHLREREGPYIDFNFNAGNWGQTSSGYEEACFPLS